MWVHDTIVASLMYDENIHKRADRNEILEKLLKYLTITAENIIKDCAGAEQLAKILYPDRQWNNATKECTLERMSESLDLMKTISIPTDYDGSFGDTLTRILHSYCTILSLFSLVCVRLAPFENLLNTCVLFPEELNEYFSEVGLKRLQDYLRTGW